VIVDCGCGEGRLGESLSSSSSSNITCHSFDMVSLSPHITPHNIDLPFPLDPCSVDVVVYCLSLMSPSLTSTLLHTNHSLKLPSHNLPSHDQPSHDHDQPSHKDQDNIEGRGGKLIIAEVRSRIEIEEEEESKRNEEEEEGNMGYEIFYQKMNILGFQFSSQVFIFTISCFKYI